MMNAHEFARLRDYIHRHSGIHLGEDKQYLVENRLSPIMALSGCRDFSDLLLKLQTDDGTLRAKVIDAMSTNETLWFRDESLFSALERDIVPELVRRARRRTVRIWSAACSTGQEPYSLAMLIDDALRREVGADPSRFEILGTDLSGTALQLARSGCYSQLALSRGMRPGFRERYFHRDGLSFELDSSIRERVTFRPFNLQEPFSALGRIAVQKFDLILCRNVLIYFDKKLKGDVYGRLAGVLRDDGLLAIGASESINGVSDAFVRTPYGKGVLYRPAARSTTRIGIPSHDTSLSANARARA
ncbi:MAG: CheR family methyltransferase [Gammaproteobacteria bacterium]